MDSKRYIRSIVSDRRSGVWYILVFPESLGQIRFFSVLLFLFKTKVMLFGLLTAIVVVEGRDSPRIASPACVPQSKHNEIPEDGIVDQDQLAELQ